VTRDDLDLFDMSTPNYPKGYHAYEECSGVGACDRASGICNCNDGYTGLGCRRSTCPNDCSGNGVCVASSEVAPVGYGSNRLLQFQKHYWDQAKSTQCICDPGYIGIDCSIRICPEDVVSSATCGGDATSHFDAQAITVSFSQPFASMETADFDSYFVLQFTDGFNAKTTSKPINFWDDPLTVQQALHALPNYALMDIKVSKIWPLQDYTESSDSDAYVSGSTLEGDSVFRNLACETWYYDAFESATCSSDNDCADKFGLAAGTTVICEATLGVCVETEGSACLVNDAIDEFNTDGCGENFEPDGIYLSTTLGGSVWGRRLGSFERKCNIGVFPTNHSSFAVPCATDADCVACSSFTQVTAGECDAGSGVCVPSTDFASTYITADLEECSTTAFIVTFESNIGGSRKNLFDCKIGADTNSDGASPRFESSALASCSSLHIGLPEWRVSPYSTGVNDLCWSQDTGTGIATNEFVDVDDVDDYETGGGFCYDLDSATASDINLVVEDQNFVRARNVNDDNSISWPQTLLFSEYAITNMFEMDYETDLPCSNAGSCDEATGLCECASGYTGEACAVETDYV